jgi:hypothetical protein
MLATEMADERGVQRPMNLVDRHNIIEDGLASWSAALGKAQEAYRGHVYRVFNCARHIFGSDDANDLFAAASVFHDLGIWSDGTFDYLGPSIARAAAFCHERAPHLDGNTVANIIENHHRLRRYVNAPDAPLVEAFRRADLVDLTGGWIRAGIPDAFLRQLRTAFPYGGFHAILVRTALGWMLRHPLRPLPMLR